MTNFYNCQLIGGPGDGHETLIVSSTKEVVYQGHVYRVRLDHGRVVASHTGEKAYTTVGSEVR